MLLPTRLLRQDVRPSRTPLVQPPPTLPSQQQQPGGSSTTGSSSTIGTGVKPQSRHISFYRIYGRPIVRVFLMSSITYYALHYLWWTLEHDEMEADKRAQVTQLAETLGDAVEHRGGGGRAP